MSLLRSEHVKASALSRSPRSWSSSKQWKPSLNRWKSSRRSRPLSPDPSDQMMLDLAINGRAEALVYEQQKTFCGCRKEVRELGYLHSWNC